MIIKHIMHSREQCFSYCHKNIKGQKYELKQRMKQCRGGKAKTGVRRGVKHSFLWFLLTPVPWDAWDSLVRVEELH